MKKLVIKTVFITIIVMLSVSIAVMSAICIFKPKVIAKTFDDLGKYQASQYFYEMQYNKTKDIEELIVLIDIAYKYQDNNDLISYLEKLMAHKDYKAYCQSEDSKLAPNEIKTEQYYQNWYDELLSLTQSAG